MALDDGTTIPALTSKSYAENVKKSIKYALDGIEGSTNGEYRFYLDAVATVVKNTPQITAADIARVQRDLCDALIRKGITAEDADYLVGNAFDGEGRGLRYNMRSAKDILTGEFPEPPWVIPNLLRVGLTALGGSQKLGKSWLGLQMLCAVAHGGKVFDEKVERAPGLYIATEDPPWRLKERMQRQRWDEGNRLADFLTMGDFRKHIGDLSGGGSEILAKLIRDNQYRLTIIDTFSRTFSGDQNDVQEMTNALSPIQAAAHELQAAVLVIDHHRKAVPEKRDPVADILGSTAKGAVVDTALGLYRDRGKNEAELHICGRDVEDAIIQLTMDWSIGTWQKVGDSSGIHLPYGQRNALKYLRAVGKSSLKRVCDGVGKDFRRGRGTVHKDLQELRSKGLVTLTDDGDYETSGVAPDTLTRQHTQQRNGDNSATTQQTDEEPPF